MTIALATPVLRRGDAVGNDLLGMADVLRSRGTPVKLFAEKSHIDVDVYPLAELSPTDAERLIYHHSVQCDVAVRAVEAFGSRAIVKYHNVTPSRFFADVNPDAVRGSEIGHQQSIRLAKSSATFWVDSDFNGRDLAASVPGFTYHELPPFHQASELMATRPDDVGEADAWPTTLLCVGRVAPNKNLLLAVETLVAVRENVDPLARLVIAGSHVFPNYSERVLALAERLHVSESLVVTSTLSQAQLAAWYRAADVVLVTSEHEGFCVPLVEAMALGVPVVAVPRTAVPDTGGDAIVYADADGEQLAMAIKELLADGAHREERVRAGRVRYQQRFSPAAIAERFLQLL